MLIAVCSDIHDNIWALEKALEPMRQADVAVFCGDFCAPFTLVQLAEGFAGDIHVVWGNNDGDRWLLTRNAAAFGHVHLHGEMAQVELGGMRVGVNHYPDIAGPLAASGHFDLVCYGHDHKANDTQVGGCRLLNPGELMGRFGRSSFVLLNTATGQAESVEVQAR